LRSATDEIDTTDAAATGLDRDRRRRGRHRHARHPQGDAGAHPPLLPPRDYSSRSGFPKGTEVSRGLASSFQVPEDFRTPAALQPFV
jgi:hypothetical protein